MEIAALTYPFDHRILLTRKKALREELLKNSNLLEKRVAILGGSTTAEVRNLLEIFLLKEGIKPSFYESEYNQYYSDVSFENPSLAAFNPDIIYFHTSFVNVKTLPVPGQSPEAVDDLVASETERWKSLWRHCALRYPKAAVIQNNFEAPDIRILGNLEGIYPHGAVSFIRRLNEALSKEIVSYPHVYMNDIGYLSSLLGLERWYDKNFWFSYKYAMSFEGMVLTAHSAALLIKAVFGGMRKCLVLDLDNTIWGGVVGDDGVDGLQIGKETPVAEAYTDFQRYVKKLNERGIILAVCSKNDPANAKSGFQHPDNILKFDDFAVFKANWENKDKNIREIAQELNIGLDALVFVDDNPAERVFVKSQLPQVAVPPMGDDIAQYKTILDRSGYFEPAAISDEDLKRSQYYEQQNRRQISEESFSDYGDFLRSLEMKAEIASFQPVYIERITQLTNKTNQFNLTTRRYTLAEVSAIANDSRYIKLQGRLSDKFGDNGLISVVIAQLEGTMAHVQLWLMSCRVLKRDMELAMMDRLIEKCHQCGVRQIKGYYFKTAKNAMVAEFYKNLGFSLMESQENGDSIWLYDIPDSYQNQNRYIETVSVAPKAESI
ncbi:MAG: HAD-IIIC family phosphatase [Candidatus Omnitrophica bacterium]|nr:HAD-IIIC family phosphatase [Candidatus Omnitrophota bacterium]